MFEIETRSEKGMNYFLGQVWKRVQKIITFWFEIGSGYGEPSRTPYQKFRVVPPPSHINHDYDFFFFW